MADAFSQFGLLLASVWESKDGPALVQRVAATDARGGMLLFAADRSGGRHILAPITDDYAFRESRGAAIETAEWRHPKTRQRYMDLVCTVDGLARVFYRLADSVTERIQDEQECHAALISALADFRELLKPAPSLSDQALRGLVGELTVLALIAGRNPIYAVESWSGPNGHQHDFATPHGDIEVKASEREGRTVEISSLGQLDDIGGAPVCLVRLRVEDAPNGKRIRDLVDDLVALGCLRSQLLEKLELAGFTIGVTTDEMRFVVPEPPIAWRVTDDFPGLRTADIPEQRRAAVTGIRYTLDLLDAPGEMSEHELDSYLDEVMSQ